MTSARLPSATGAILALALAVIAVAPASASAQVYCVPSGGTAGCANPGAMTLQQALDAATTDPSPDTIDVAAGTYQNGSCASGGFSYAGSQPVTVIGAGIGQTILTCPSGYDDSGNYWRIFQFTGPGSISQLTIHLPAGKYNRGLGLEHSGASADHVAIDTDPAAGGGAEGAIVDGGAFRHGTISMPLNDDDRGVFLIDHGIVDDVGVVAGGEAIAGEDGTVAHARLAAPQGVSIDAGTMTVYDSEIDVTSAAVAQQAGLLTDNGTLDARNLTIVGGGKDAVGAWSDSADATDTTALTLTDSVISGPATALERTAVAGSTANLTASYDDYPAGSSHSSGPGSDSEQHQLHAAPGFVNPTMGVFQPAPGSPLIDAATPGGLTAGEPATDLAGLPRILNGSIACAARRDIGAYEYTPGMLPVRASATLTRVRVGQPVKFRGSGCSIDPSLTPTFTWIFGDGTHLTGATTVTHRFTTAGLHRVSLTVSDSAHRTGRATVLVTVVVRPVLSKPKLKRGTLSYSDGSPAFSTFTLYRRLGHGRLQRIRSFGHKDHAGRNLLRLPIHTLRAGDYILVGVARNVAGSSRPLRVPFSIRR